MPSSSLTSEPQAAEDRGHNFHVSSPGTDQLPRYKALSPTPSQLPSFSSSPSQRVITGGVAQWQSATANFV